jgi:hypothetical protein
MFITGASEAFDDADAPSPRGYFYPSMPRLILPFAFPSDSSETPRRLRTDSFDKFCKSPKSFNWFQIKPKVHDPLQTPLEHWHTQLFFIIWEKFRQSNHFFYFL